MDRLLSSPRFGEHWSRHWLDVARYSDTKGYVYAREERFFIQASNYRDWVMNAFSEDMPYDRFVLLQLAADQVAPNDLEAQAAMGFLTMGRRFLGVPHDIIDDRIDVVPRGLLGLTVACARCHDHKFDPISTAEYYGLYGVFNNCMEQRVRIRSGEGPAWQAFDTELNKRQEKYREALQKEREAAADRVRQRIVDYLMAQLELEKYPADGFDVLISKDDLVPRHVRRFQNYLLDAAEQNDSLFVAWRGFAAIEARKSEIDFAKAAEGVVAMLKRLPAGQINLLVAQKFSSAPATMREVAERYAALFQSIDSKEPRSEPSNEPTNAAERAAVEQLAAFWRGKDSPCEVPDEDIVGIEHCLDTRTCESLWKLQGEVDRWINQSELPPAFTVTLGDRPQIREPNIFKRGNPRSIGPRVPRQFLAALSSANDGSSQSERGASNKPSLKIFQAGSGRRELAESIVDPRNPLTARVWVNRIWQHLFGQGLVSTPSDFGVRSGQPSHPGLLDWLAEDFLRQGQSSKSLIRRIVSSAAYQRASIAREEADLREKANDRDPSNRLLWKGVTKRLSFEQQRDTWLVAARQMDWRWGGRAKPLFSEGSGAARRSIYGQIDRQFLPGVLRIFDFANPDLHIPMRSETTVPQQALFGLNHLFAAETARHAVSAARLNTRQSAGPPTSNGTSSEASAGDEPVIGRLFEQILGRRPSSEELIWAQQFLAQPGETPPKPSPESLAWQYGFGKWDPAAGKLENFKPLPYFSGAGWQGGTQWPDAKLGWAQLTATGGHAGNDLDHAVIRRWTAPRNMTLQMRSTAAHEVSSGDGVRCSVLTPRTPGKSDKLAGFVLHNTRAEIHLDDLEVTAGECLDFIVDFNGNLNNDQFRWTIEIRSTSERESNGDELVAWMSERDFAGPTPKYLEPLEQLAQVLLLSNELLFVD